MKVLSLFDGISCGMLALQRAGIPVECYDAFEIDKYAVTVSKRNYPDIVHHGGVFDGDFTKFKGYDLLLGGSPCTYWSIAKKGRETTSDGMGFELFMEYVRALRESECKYFLYENNYSIHQNIKDEISKHLGVQPIMINSALLSAQNRKRCYWTNIPNVTQPDDLGIMLADVLENAVPWQDKSYCMTSTYNGAVLYNTLERKQRTMVAIPVNTVNGKAHTVPATYYKAGTNLFPSFRAENSRQKIAVPICVNSQSGNATIPTRKQPSLSERIYSIEGKNPALTSGFHTNIAVPVETVTDENSDTDLNAPIPINTFNNEGEKSRTIMSGYYKYGEATLIKNKGFKGGATAVAEPVGAAQRGRYVDGNKTEQHIEVRPDGKSNCLTTVQKDSLVCAPVRIGQYGKGGQGQRIYSVRGKSVTLSANGGGQGAKTGLYKIDLPDDDYIIRKLTPVEAERLQTLPDNYTAGISNSQRYKCIGNGWTVDVIAHILGGLRDE
jgi:DNA (cytosine-5)-methyltransferase 3A